MTDKQIIIDGVDVISCNHFDMNFKHCDILGRHCREHNNCYYKQLQRKEQECETLEKALKLQKGFLEHTEKECEELKNIINKAKNSKLDLKSFLVCEAVQFEYEQQLDQLKAENEELKKQVNDLLHKPEIQDKILWKIDNETLLGSKDAWIYKLEKTLTEIKEIAEEAAEQSGVFKEYFKRNNYSWKQHQLRALTCKFNIILQKINEVIDD